VPNRYRNFIPFRRWCREAREPGRIAQPQALVERRFRVSQKLVGVLLRQLGYSCRANRKTREGRQHADRDAQFDHVNATVRAAIAAGEPAISVDTKKKQLVGDFKNPGRELRPKGQPEPVCVHDFELPDLGKVAPCGVYGIAANAGWVSVGQTPTPPPSRWRASGAGGTGSAAPAIPKPGACVTADCGGSNGVRVRL
jgi:Rhodopirellula transposase DDE domain